MTSSVLSSFDLTEISAFLFFFDKHKKYYMKADVNSKMYTISIVMSHCFADFILGKISIMYLNVTSKYKIECGQHVPPTNAKVGSGAKEEYKQSLLNGHTRRGP
jgi:hypothetical protein